MIAQDMIGKVYQVTYKHPPQSGSSRDTYPKIGRIVKHFDDGTRVLMVNPECSSVDDVTGKYEIFKWGSWIELEDAEFKEINE